MNISLVEATSKSEERGQIRLLDSDDRNDQLFRDQESSRLPAAGSMITGEPGAARRRMYFVFVL
jgi:hypothetical protein